MVKRTSKQSIREEQERYAALAAFRRAPRIMGVEFAHDDIDPPLALRVSHNEEPHEIFMCGDRKYLEIAKAKQRERALWDFEDAFRQHTVTPSPWGNSRKPLDGYTPDYFDSYRPEDRGDPGLELLPF